MFQRRVCKFQQKVEKNLNGTILQTRNNYGGGEGGLRSIDFDVRNVVFKKSCMVSYILYVLYTSRLRYV